MTLCRCGLPSFGYAECYYHAKAHVDWTSSPPASNGLSPEQRAFVGLFDPKPNRGGWRQPDAMPTLAAFHDEDGEAWMSDEEKRLLQVLCEPPSRGWGGDPDGS